MVRVLLHAAPLSLVVITPALAGPYDYGTIVVRVALRVTFCTTSRINCRS